MRGSMHGCFPVKINNIMLFVQKQSAPSKQTRGGWVNENSQLHAVSCKLQVSPARLGQAKQVCAGHECEHGLWCKEQGFAWYLLVV